ncbi:MAG: hypothetical protein HND51_06455 [Chloroflexi bacterium]|nr:hypothetical protein [Chloroflexota bacterium]
MDGIKLLLISVFLLAACAAEPGLPTPSASPESEQTPTPIDTLPPTAGVLVRQPTATNNPFNLLPVPSALPTWGPITSQLDRAGLISAPNEKWVVDFSLGLEIYHIGGQSIWQMERGKAATLYGGTNWGLFHWSPDSQYLYLTRVPSFSAIPRVVSMYNSTGLWRLDILSGEIVEYLPGRTITDGGNEKFIFREIQISPDAKKIAHIEVFEKPFELIIQEVESEVQQVFPLGERFFSIGYMAWSPEMNSIIFVGAVDETVEVTQNYPTQVRYLLMHVDLTTGVQTELLDMGDRGYIPRSWSQEEIIQLVEYPGWTCDILNFDISAREFISTIKPTAFPAYWPVDSPCHP